MEALLQAIENRCKSILPWSLVSYVVTWVNYAVIFQGERSKISTIEKSVSNVEETMSKKLSKYFKFKKLCEQKYLQ